MLIHSMYIFAIVYIYFSTYTYWHNIFKRSPPHQTWKLRFSQGWFEKNGRVLRLKSLLVIKFNTLEATKIWKSTQQKAAQRYSHPITIWQILALGMVFFSLFYKSSLSEIFNGAKGPEAERKCGWSMILLQWYLSIDIIIITNTWCVFDI